MYLETPVFSFANNPSSHLLSPLTLHSGLTSEWPGVCLSAFSPLDATKSHTLGL